jgi:hypothetical protein
MESTHDTKTSATQSRNENVTCWQTATSPQCLRVETASEIHLFPYGYFRRAIFSREGNKDNIEIQFQGATVVAKGKGLEPLCDALARLSVERINACPEKYATLNKGDGFIVDIQIKPKSDTQ